MSTRIWALVCAVAAVAVLAGGWLLGVQPQFDTAAAADASTSAVETTNQGIQVRLSGLAKVAARQQEMQEQDAVLRKSVPAILKPNTLIRRINELAALHDVKVQAVAPGDAAAYTAPVAATPSTPASATSTTPASAGTPTPAATPAPAATTPTPVAGGGAATAAAGPQLALTDPLITPDNFVAVPVTVTVTGTVEDILTFSTALQNDERVFLVNGVAISKDDQGVASGTLKGYVYTLKR